MLARWLWFHNEAKHRNTAHPAAGEQRVASELK